MAIQRYPIPDPTKVTEHESPGVRAFPHVDVVLASEYDALKAALLDLYDQIDQGHMAYDAAMSPSTMEAMNKAAKLLDLPTPMPTLEPEPINGDYDAEGNYTGSDGLLPNEP